MKSCKIRPCGTLFQLLIFMSAFQHAHSLSQQYCSSQNTGSDYTVAHNIYQSNGACQDECAANYAFAIVQYQNCWCSNYAPSNQQDVSSCNTNCPGFPAESCGNPDQSLYGYIALNRSPSGTAGGASSSARSTQAASSATSQRSSAQASSRSSDPTSTTSTTSSISSLLTTSELAATTPSNDALTQTTLVSTRVLTVSGAPVTQTVTSTPMVANSGTQQLETSQRKSVSPGTVAGAVVGSIVGLALLIAGAFFLWRRRRRNDASETLSTTSSSARRKMERNTSVLSKTGLLSSGGPDIEKSSYDGPGALNTSTNKRSSAMFAAGPPGTSPVSPVVGGAFDDSSQRSRRNSRPLVYDQRLNPNAIMQNWEANGSRASVGTMQDQRDYSRPLGVTNPDPVDD